MHELHLLKSLFSDLLNHATTNNAAKITKVFVRMGEFTEINEDILRHFFTEKSVGTPVEGAQLVVEKSQARELTLVSFDCE